MIISKYLKTTILLICWLTASSAWATLNVSPIFGSDMVLQRNTTVPVFGTADPGETVTVLFNGQSSSAVADANGDWRVDLASMAASSSPGPLTVETATDFVSFAGVQVGEVWLCSGQSNMGFSLDGANDSSSAIADAGNHNIRLFRMTSGNGPATSDWQISSSSTAGDFSAVGYWMGLELSQWFGDVPIGLIQATHDGTSIDRWQHTSGGIGDDYDAMVRAIQPFAVKGVAWYQGESNGGDTEYATKLTNMINEWRADWGQAELPFGIIQLADRSGWNTARNAQLEVADTLSDAFLVVIKDLAGGSLHPPEKKPVGIRTAIGARGLVYGEPITYSGPIRDAEGSYVSGNTVVLNWKHLGGGLFTDDGLPPGEFKVAAATGQFKTADAVIVGDTVEVSSSFVAEPTRVQYAYKSAGNLFNYVDIPTEGGGVIVDRLMASEFEIEVAPSGVNSPPTASFSFTTSSLTVNFDGSQSLDNDGVIAAWEWDFGDGNSASGEFVSHTYSAPGSYSVSLTVTDNDGAATAKMQTVSVSDGSSGGGTTHVDSVTTYTQNEAAGQKRGVAEVVVQDDQGTPVNNATVTGTFSGSFAETVSAQTGPDGVATLLSSGASKGNVSVDLCVDAIDHGSLSYDASQNTVTCSSGAN